MKAKFSIIFHIHTKKCFKYTKYTEINVRTWTEMSYFPFVVYSCSLESYMHNVQANHTYNCVCPEPLHHKKVEMVSFLFFFHSSFHKGACIMQALCLAFLKFLNFLVKTSKSALRNKSKEYD